MNIGSVAPAAILNVGNTCFVNALVQCMMHLPGIKGGINQKNSSNVLDQAIVDICDEFEGKTNAVNISHAIQPLITQIFECGLGRQGQNDPDEFFQECMHGQGVTESLFRFKMNETIKCNRCTEDVVSVHTVEPNYVTNLKYDAFSKARNITELIIENIRGDTLEDYSPSPHNTKLGVLCTGDQGAHKFEYFKGCLPELMCLSLPSLVSFSRHDKRQKKERRYFKPEMILDLPEFGSALKMRMAKYKLHGMVVHIGAETSHGHFVAYVLQLETDKWYWMVSCLKLIVLSLYTKLLCITDGFSLQ